MKTYHLFISYSRLDDINYKKRNKQRSAIDNILDRLRKEQIKFWIDRDGKYCGEDFEEIIVNALDNSEMLLFISSNNSNTKSEWVVREIKNARRKKMKIIPLLIDNTPFSKKIELTLEDIENRLYYENPQEALDKVVGSIKDHIAAIKKEEEEAIEKAKKEEAQKKEEEERVRKAEIEKKRIEKLKEELVRIKTHLIGAITKQQFYLGKWNAKQKELAAEASCIIECPVCQTSYEDGIDHCEVCGWHFGLPPELLMAENRQLYEDRLATATILWNQKTETDNCFQALQTEQDALKAKLESTEKELAEVKTKNKELQEEHSKSISAKQNEISHLRVELAKNKSQLSTVQTSLSDLTTKYNQLVKERNEEALKPKPSSNPIAFLLVTEFDQTNVYLLHEDRNVFGAMSPQTQTPEYQMLVVTEEKLRPQHFEIDINKANKQSKQFSFKIKPIDTTCLLAYNSSVNTIKTEQTVYVGDILYIGNVKIQIKDNFNK